MQWKYILNKNTEPPCMGICPSIPVSWRSQERRRIRTRGRKRRKRVVRLIIMYSAGEMWARFLGGYFFQNVFIPDFCVLQPTVIETGFHIFLMAKYCPALSEHYADAGGWRERVDHQLDWLLHSPSSSFVGLPLSGSDQPAQCHPVFNHGALVTAKIKWIKE